MDPEALRRRKQQTPFQPFELVLADGSRHLVADPLHLLVGSRTTAVWLPHRGEEDLTLLSNADITSVVPPAGPGGG